MKKRYVDGSRLRKMKKSKISERISESAYTFLKFLVVWILVLLADFILEFRFEYLWPCWLFFGSVYTTFHCHGLVICVVFVSAAFTLDVFCLIFVPLHWLFFAASTYVLFNYIWHTEKGLCVSTISLWILLMYTETSLRFKDVKNSHVNLSHLFAAHCIGYPVVYLGFDATCYFTSVFKLRSRKAVQSENDFHMQLLLQSLPPGLQLYPKCLADSKENSKWKTKPECTQYQCSNVAVSSEDKYVVDCLQIDGVERRSGKDLEDTKLGCPLSQPLDPKGSETDIREDPPGHEQEPDPQGASSSMASQEEPGNRGPKTCKASSPKVRRVPSNSTAPCLRGDRKPKGSKATSPSREMTERNIPSNQSSCLEQVTKLEQEMRRLKGELQTSKQAEVELRSHMCNLTNSERSLRPEVSLLRQANDSLQNKILWLMKTKQKDKQTSTLLEKKVKVEMESRIAAEKQLAELQSRKLDEAPPSPHGGLLSASRQEQTETLLLKRKAKDLETEFRQLQLESQGKESQIIALENEVEVLRKYESVEHEAEMLLSALTAMQDKTQHLEYNLSAETRIKLDLFSALGDVRRQLEIAQGRTIKQDQEIGEMKKKIAEVMAVMPGITYTAPYPIVPHLTKFLSSEDCVLDRTALMYQCLKK
ncbi:macoilin-1 [Brienomyrus brachyistius]|uniref:macoilin-1 n=1 Tax=Brienomyrus brachyistius TaxID=42636 RepID=UPI0020B3FEF4|nr:macoilin-1 [Brienomyrus brachyistius]